MTPFLRRFWPLLLVALVAALVVSLDLGRSLSVEALAARRGELAAFVAARPLAAAALFVTLYVATIVCLLPVASLLTVGSGLVFGWLLGGALSVAAATIGACLLFLAARHAFGDLLRRHAGAAVARFAAGFNRDAFSYLLVLRLTPVFPFFALNVAPAFLGVPFRTFAATTLLGIVPGTMVYAFLGSGLDGALAAAAAKGAAVSLADLVTTEAKVALLGLAALALLGLLLKRLVLKPGRGAAPNPKPATAPGAIAASGGDAAP